MGHREDFTVEWAQLKTEWEALSPQAKRAAWDRFTLDIDEGVGGWNRYHPILWPAFELGDQVLLEAMG